MTHLLVTNDFPPRLGGIQSYLYELWRRLPAGETVVLTTAHPDAAEWDARQPFRIVRQPDNILLPTPAMVARIDELADEVGADLVLLDPVWPLGFCGPQLSRPYGIVLHGSEVTVPGRLPFVQLLARRTLRSAELVVAAGGYPASEGHRVAGRDLPTAIVPPGVDTTRFVPLDADARRRARESFALDPDATIVLGVSRLVPRKGFDVIAQAVHRLAEDYPSLHLVIAGDGRDRARLEQVTTALGVSVTFLGAVDDEQLASLYGCVDIFAMACRTRWVGLEQEGFGIVFLEAAAAGVPSIAGRSGGSAEAVIDGETGFVVDEPRSVDDVADALARLLDEPALRSTMGAAARARAERSFSYDLLAVDLQRAIRSTIERIALPTSGPGLIGVDIAPSPDTIADERHAPGAADPTAADTVEVPSP